MKMIQHSRSDGKNPINRFVKKSSDLLKLLFFERLHFTFFFHSQRDQDRPEMLKEYEVIAQPISKCKKPSDFNARNDSVICTRTNVVNTLNVLDNGSALVSKMDGKLIGMASWHDGETPRVYIKVGPYIPWIRSIAFPSL